EHDGRGQPLGFDRRSLPFFFQAEDGIRDGHVTGVQTCALPISAISSRTSRSVSCSIASAISSSSTPRGTCTSRCTGRTSCSSRRSEERRVGKEWRPRWAAYHKEKKT